MTEMKTIARRTGAAWLATIVIGIAAAVFVGRGLDINLSADVEAVATAMLQAEARLRAMAYVNLLLFALDLMVSIGLFLLLRPVGMLLAAWSLAARIGAGMLSVLSAMFLMNSAEIASRPAYQALAEQADRLLLNGVQATSTYTSFHLSIVLSSAAMAGFFWLFLKSRKLPAPLAAWGVFASLFVAGAVVARDFVPAIGHPVVTVAFMASNLVAILGAAIYLCFLGVREQV
jgi:hypothetical protein